MSMKIDGREFHKALLDYSKYSKSTLSKIINRRAFFIVRRAMQYTKKAELKAITADLGTKAKPKRLARGLAREKDPSLSGDALMVAAGRLVARRRSAVGFEKSGWVHAARKLARSIKAYHRGRAKRMRQKSTAKPAKETWSPIAEFVYNKYVKSENGDRFILPSTRRALEVAWRVELRGMKQETRRRMQAAANRVNAR